MLSEKPIIVLDEPTSGLDWDNMCAVANAVNNFGADESSLRISECYINPGPVYKRIKFASRGNVDRHDKRSSHITVCVSDAAKGVK